ncbi:MAG TPA: ATP synthase F0 subunit C [Kofleriaceae bacterium]|nr:ATP synthase F0 subunit C [Kofleriaceae bacterium]
MTKRTVKFLFSLSTMMVVMGLSAIAFAQGGGDAVAAAKASAGGWIGLGAGLGIGLAAFGGALGQGRASSAFLDGVSRNPGASDKVFVPMILGLVFIESLAIYALIIAFLLLGKVS